MPEATTDNPELATELRDKALRFFKFLRELSRLKSRTVRNIDAYEDVFWLADLESRPGCTSALEGEAAREKLGADTWLEIRQPEVTDHPAPPGMADPWLSGVQLSDPRAEPEIREFRTDTRLLANPVNGKRYEQVEHRLDDSPNVHAAWERYLDEKWRPWASSVRDSYEALDLYTRLYRMYQKQLRLGEQFEVVIAVGLLTWRIGSDPVKRHVITTPAELRFDTARGIIRVGVPADEVRARFETDMLEPTELPTDARIAEELRADIAQLASEVLVAPEITASLQSWAHALDAGGKFVGDQTAPARVPNGDLPQITWSPALVLRRRSERSIIEFYDAVLEGIEAGDELPDGLQHILQEPSSQRKGDGEPEYPQGEAAERTLADDVLFFPLESNDEQAQIVERLSYSQGVLVQGPPGTGKSHTIANLICHLLASGKRVLVTAEAPRALAVLRDKLPPEIADLCVLLLGHDRRALRELEDSIQQITAEFSQWDPRREQNRVSTLLLERRSAREREEAAMRELVELGEGDAGTFDRGGYRGTPLEIAEQLNAETSKYGWFEDDPAELASCPVNNEAGAKLAELLGSLSDDQLDELELLLPPLEQLPTAEHFASLVENYRTAVEALQQATPSDLAKELASADQATVEPLRLAAGALAAALHAVESRAEPWAAQALADVLGDRDRLWRELQQSSAPFLDQIERHIELLRRNEVDGIGARELATVRAEAADLIAHLEGGGGWGFLFIKAAPVRRAAYLASEVRIDGALCNSLDRLRELDRWLEGSIAAERLRKLWRGQASVELPETTVQAAAVAHDAMEVLALVLASHEHRAKITELASSAPAVAEVEFTTSRSVATLASAADAALASIQLRESEGRLRALTRMLDAHRADPESQHPTIGQLGRAIEQRDVAAYASARQRAESLSARSKAVEASYAQLDRLRGHAPRTVAAFEESRVDTVWPQRLGSVEEAWNWASARAWIKRRCDPLEVARLSGQASLARKNVNQLTAKVAARRAWQKCFDRMTRREEAHLNAWSQAIKRVGGGTGKHAHHYRAEAQKHLAACRSAIPAWVMPLYRVVETMRPGRDLFDVVIVDEASQLGPEGLLLHSLGKKVIVVGDDKQISPTSFLKKDDVFKLRRDYVPDLPFNDLLDPETSLFAQAGVRFSGAITLREHFRCMPEIIEFSNKLCYAKQPLIPMRQFGVDRLDPVVQAVFVEDGYTEGRRDKYNPAEAEALIDKIEECLNDPAYEGKSMGVICLVGEAQAKHIEQSLLLRVGPDEMERRRLICGNAYAFQGDERDVMFLSMVQAPGTTTTSLTGETYRQRFNVAASRARDQSFLFHSVRLDELPSPEDMRFKILDYFQNPQVSRLAPDGIDVDALAIAAGDSHERQSAAPYPFDSWFEVDVFLRLYERGYRVIPQVEQGNYRIDLVVQGMSSRLAIECDGDQWHGPQEYEADLYRQRALERCGLHFWRVRGSAFYADPDAALATLWDALASHNIRPEDQWHAASAPTGEGTDGLPVKAADPWVSASAPTQEQLFASTGAQQLDLSQAGEDAAAATLVRCSISDICDEGAYQRWSGVAPDPLTQESSTVTEAVSRIVECEGPVTADRVVEAYMSELGLGNATGVGHALMRIKAAIRSAIRGSLRNGELQAVDELELGDDYMEVIRRKGQQDSRVRPRGPRSTAQLPPSEVAVAAGRSLHVDHTEATKDEFRARALELYGMSPDEPITSAVVDAAWRIYLTQDESESIRSFERNEVPRRESRIAERPAQKPSDTVVVAPEAGLVSRRGDAELAAYSEWGTDTSLPDLRSGNRCAKIEGLRQIVEVEGPVIGDRLYQLYVRSNGGRRVGRQLRTMLDGLAAEAVRNGVLSVEDALPTGSDNDRTFRLPQQPAVIVRELGPRSLVDVPPRELATVIAALRAQGVGHGEPLYRAVLGRYGLKRLTERALARIEACAKLATDL